MFRRKSALVRQMTIAAGLWFSACVVSTVGAPCVDDTNCPMTQRCTQAGKCEVGERPGIGGGGGTTGGGGGATGGGGGATGGGGGTTGGGGGTTGGGGGATGGGGGATGGGGGATGGGGGAVQVAPTLEIVNVSGQMQGGTFTMDMQVGHSRSQAPMNGGNTTLETGAAVKP